MKQTRDFAIDTLSQVWCLIVYIPDLCPVSYFAFRYAVGVNMFK